VDSRSSKGVPEPVPAAQDNQGRRGRLKIYFGAAAGVGKTYAMLSEAHEKRAEGWDVVIGVLDAHGRADTAAVLEGLEVLPPRLIQRDGEQVQEFDLDAALARRPALVLVDELAHANADGARHAKRWNDVHELLDAGIDVYTTLNVQHLESLNDIIGGITHVRVVQTVPDKVFESADEIELVDLPPDDLLERLREDETSWPEDDRSLRHFFSKGNLIALRELALRLTAEHVDATMRNYREDNAIRDVWRARERVLVCIGPNPLAEPLVRAGKRLASSARADWIVAYVETPKLRNLPEDARDKVLACLKLAEELGARAVTLTGQEMGEEILEFAYAHDVTKIVMGKPIRTGWRRWILGSVVDTIVREARDLDVHLIANSPEPDISDPNALTPPSRSRASFGLLRYNSSDNRRFTGYLWAVGVTMSVTIISFPMFGHFRLATLVLLYLLGVVFVASRFGFGQSVLASVLSVMAFDFFFVPPPFVLLISDEFEDLVMVVLMLLVALIVSNLTANLRAQAAIARQRERRTTMLYELTRDLANAQTVDDIADVAIQRIGAEFPGQCSILLPDAAGRVGYSRSKEIKYIYQYDDLGIAQWVYDHGKTAGQGTDTLPESAGIYFPISGALAPLGVLALVPDNLQRVFLPEQHRLIEMFTSQVAQALERIQLAKDAQASAIKAETESLRNSLLSAISHDFRSPLASIVGASSGLLEGGAYLTEEEKLELTRTVHEEARRMSSLATNILNMARLEAGVVVLNCDWYPVDEIVGGVLTRLQNRLLDYPVTTNLAPGLPLVKIDAVMIGQVLENLLENAIKYTPPGTSIEIGASCSVRDVAFWVADSGPGIPAGAEELLFDKFYRGTKEAAQSGAGLGLTICRAIVKAHGGQIRAENRPGGGTLFQFVIPITEKPPRIVPEEEQLAGAQ